MEARLYRDALAAFGRERAVRIRNAPAWFRAVHNGWPVLFTHGRSDLIQLFSSIVTRVPRTMSNWRAFLALAQHANWNDEFLSAAVEWAKRTIELLLAFHHMNAPGSNATKLQMYICGFWDDPSYHRRGRLNPRVADEIAALALSCRTDNGRIGREVLPLVREFYSLSWCVSIDSADAVQILVAKVRSMPRNVDWCICYPFTASLSGIQLPRVACEADQNRMYAKLEHAPPKSLIDMPGAHFPTI